MNTILIILFLLIHWLGDFVLQTDFQAKNKSSNNIALCDHVATYSAFWLLALIMMQLFGILAFHPVATCYFVFITFACHFITDYVTSRVNSKLYKKGKIHEFFVSVGFDQILHYIQLLLTYQLLFIV